jgi:flagellar protein FliO/FliZ
MDESLFGIAMPLPVKFLLIFGFVLCVLFAFLWALRRFGTGQLGGTGTRGRQHRLSVLEWAKVDNRRSLCLVRRDNVEHLLIIGGPTDVVVEANIVRAAPASRDVALARPAAVEPLPRAIPLPDNGNGSWPLQPEAITPPPPARPAPKIEPASDEAPAWPPLQPQADTPPSGAAAPARPQRDTLAALADELSARPAPPPPLSRVRNPAAARAPLEARAEPRVVEPRPEPRAPAAPAVQAAPTPTPADTAAADQSLAEMAHRLEAALRKPNAPAEARAPSPQPRQEPRQPQPAEQAAAPEPPPPTPPQPRAARPAEPKPARSAAPPAKPPQSTTLYDNLEQEMASLLGRPTNKS